MQSLGNKWLSCWQVDDLGSTNKPCSKEQRSLILLSPALLCPAENQWGVSSPWVTFGDAGRRWTLRNLYLINFTSFLPFFHLKFYWAENSFPGSESSQQTLLWAAFGLYCMVQIIYSICCSRLTIFIGFSCLGQYYDAFPGGAVNKSDVYHVESNIMTFQNFVFWKYLLSLLETYCSCQHISWEACKKISKTKQIQRREHMF